MALFSSINREAKFLLQQKHLIAFFSIVLALSVFAVWSGIKESNEQASTIDRLLTKDAVDRDGVLAKQNSYGMVAYYSFHLTYDEPSDLAFAAMGQRDVYPWKHRVRMLALEGQIYETDSDNPELSFLGRFDFAFLASVLLPLFVIILLHDLRSSEREAGRYDLLIVTAKKQRSLWFARATVLCIFLSFSMLLPFVVGAIVTGASLSGIGLMLAIVIAHLLFWMVLVLSFNASKFANKQSSARIASVLLSIWLLVTVLIPVSSDLMIDEVIHSPSGGEIVLTQREAVNDAWDLPASDTWDAFLATHPQWQGKTQMDNTSFEWKWYYAFQQVGDQKAQHLSGAYRKATIEKDKLAGLFSLLSPPMLTQRLMSSVAQTNTQSALAYEQEIRDFHQALRDFYYPLMFNKVEFNSDTLAELPNFSDYSTVKNDKD